MKETEPLKKQSSAQVAHRHPLLDPVRGERDLDIIDFDHSVRNELGESGPIEYTVEPDIKGLPVDLVYERGVFSTASTRADGHTGEKITGNIKTILTVPLSLFRIEKSMPPPELLEVRAKVYMEKDAFESLNCERARRQLSLYRDPGDAATSSILERDLRVIANRPLNIFCHGSNGPIGSHVETQLETMKTLQEWGLRVNRPHIQLCGSIHDVVHSCCRLKDNLDQFPFEIEGALITVNRLDIQMRLGEKSLRPKWAMAYSFGTD